MTAEVFRKTNFKSTTIVDYTHPKWHKNPIICSVCIVDYNEEILAISPIESLNYERDMFYANIKHCEIHDPKIKKLNP